MEDKKRMHCPNCSQLFHLKFSQPKGNIPLFLQCGHSVCESCITNLLKFQEPIKCQICHHDMTISSADVAALGEQKIKLYKLFPVNVAMLGQLALDLIEGVRGATTQKENDYFIDLKAICEVDKAKSQCIECHKMTSKMCHKCSIIVCEPCFTKSHNNFAGFKSHVLQNIESVLLPSCCKTHKEKPLDYYCWDCAKPICIDCMMVGRTCKTHNVVVESDVTEGFLEELNDITPKVTEIFKRMTKTAVDVGHILYKTANGTGSPSQLSKMEYDIKQHFSQILSVILKHEQEALDIIDKLKRTEENDLYKAKEDLTNALKKASTVLNSIKLMTDEKKMKEINIPSLLHEAKEIVNSPWYLNKEASKGPLKITVNKDLCALVGEYVHIERNTDSIYKLCSTSEIGEGIEIPPPPSGAVYPPELPKDVRFEHRDPNLKKSMLDSLKDKKKYKSKTWATASQNSKENEYPKEPSPSFGAHYQSSTAQSVQMFQEKNQPKELGDHELVYITHIVDPFHFYARKVCHEKLMQEMAKEFIVAFRLPKPSFEQITEGKLCLLRMEVINLWQRCRVVQINNNGVSGPTFQVFCIDSGNMETVKIDRLRVVAPRRIESPQPLAIKCYLANCEPVNGCWTEDDVHLIQKIIAQNQTVIHIRNVHYSYDGLVTFECDVTTFDHGVSLSHALAFQERAQLINPELPYPKTMSEPPRIVINNNDFNPKYVQRVTITEIVDPDKFFVRKVNVLPVYQRLCYDLAKEYDTTSDLVFLPVIGILYAVNLEGACHYRLDSRWARGVVRALPGNGNVLVQLPDTGAVVLVHWRALRHLHAKLNTLSALATECYLAGLKSLTKNWSPKSSGILHRFEGIRLELHVDVKRGDALGVTLYDTSHENNIVCINAEMIKYGVAVEDRLTESHDEDLESRKMHRGSPPDQQTPHLKANSPVTMLKTDTPLNLDEKDLEDKDKGPLRLEAKLLKYHSPSLLYLRLVDQEKIFSELYEKIQKHYSKNNTQTTREWSENDRCCTICKESHTWRRAIIMSVDGSNAKVFFTDFACTETVAISSLRELTPEFASIGDAAVKCHLCGIMPSGEDWPTVTKEYLKELLDDYRRLQVTKSGHFKEKSMPIELWVYHTTYGGALDPNVYEWRCLNQKLIEQGLALPDKTNQLTQGDENLSAEAERMQLKPMPTKPLTTDPGVNLSNSDTTSQLEHGKENAPKAAEPSNTIFISEWLPAKPLERNEFTGMPTSIDQDGVIYLHDVEEQETLHIIHRALDVRFMDRPDPKWKFNKWTVGESCIAKYSVDDHFYRGKVLEVNEDESTCTIRYVDYGNDEVCSFENLRKSVALHSIPIQAHKCVLSRIRPTGGRWDRATIDHIHKIIIEKMCFVRVAGETIDGLTPIDLKCDQLCINDHLVDFDVAEYTDKSIVREFAPVANKPFSVECNSIKDENDTYYEPFDSQSKEGNQSVEAEEKNSMSGTLSTYPDYESKDLLCSITIINDSIILDLSVIHNDELNLSYEKMYEEIKNEGSNMPPLDGIFSNKACVALFPEDGMWYRATILQYNQENKLIKIRYVDYGNTGVVPLADTREAKKEWTNWPPSCIPVKLQNITINPKIGIEEISKKYTETFLNKGPFRATIISNDGDVSVVELRNDAGELVYENLINEGIFFHDHADVD